jgi:hypothetical protein
MQILEIPNPTARCRWYEIYVFSSRTVEWLGVVCGPSPARCQTAGLRRLPNFRPVNIIRLRSGASSGASITVASGAPPRCGGAGSAEKRAIQ